MDCHVLDVQEDPSGDIQRHTAILFVADVCLPFAMNFHMGLTVYINLSIGAGCTRKLIFMLRSILIQGTLIFKIAGAHSV